MLDTSPAAHQAVLAVPADHTVLPASARRFLDQLLSQRRLSPLTQRRYAQALRVLHHNHPELQTIHHSKLQQLIGQQHAAGLSPRSLAVLVAAWRSYFQWALHQGLIRSKASDDLLIPKKNRSLPKAIAIDAVTGYLTVPDQAPPHAAAPHAASTRSMDPQTKQAVQLRDQAMLELLYGCGLRTSELISLDCYKSTRSMAWVDCAQRKVHVLGKGNKPRTIPLPSAALAAIEQWLEQRPVLLGAHCPALSTDPTLPAPLFLGLRAERISATVLRRVSQLRAKQCNLGQGVHPHMLRHSYASHLLQSSGDLRGVQELLGHASIQATQVYTHLDFQHLSRVYDLTHPRSGAKPLADQSSS